jgi:hypothetical protein
MYLIIPAFNEAKNLPRVFGFVNCYITIAWQRCT